MVFYSIPKSKILDLSKLKAFEEGTKSVLKNDFLFGKSRKHCEKKRRCWLPAFSPFPSIFQTPSFSMSIIVC